MRHAKPCLPSLALALAAAAALSGCAEDFPPASVVEDLRVLALLADPPELDGRDPAAETRVTAVEAAPPSTTTAGRVRTWSFCPFTLGASTGYACAVPQCETPLVPAADGSVAVRPVELAAQCLAAFGGALPPDVLGGGTLPEQVEVVVRYRTVQPADPGAGAPEVVREAVQRIPVWTVAPTRALNTAPAFDAVPLAIGENQAPLPCDLAAPLGSPACPPVAALPEGGRLLLRAQVTPASFEDYPAGDRTATEALAVSFFTSAGRFTGERGAPSRAAPSTTTELKDEKLVAPEGRAFLWAVVRDLRGGQAVTGPYLVTVPVRP